MNKLKKTRFFSLGRKWIFTLALFLLVFAAASVVKIQAGTEHSVSKWLGGWSEDGAGNFTGVGWISMNSTNCDLNTNGYVDTGNCGGSDNASTPVFSYGVSIPSSDGPIAGNNNYAWSPNIGWVSFNSGELGDCPSAPCNARRSGDKLEGWARVIGIKSEFEKTPSNSGGWQGWIKLSSVPGDPFSYGVRINSDGTFVDCNPTSGGLGCAWSGENKIADVPQGLGWIDFAEAKYTPPPPPPKCVTGMSTCSGDPIESCNKDTDCMDSISCTVTSDYSWTCSNGNVAEDKTCPAIVDVPDAGECGTAASINFCGESSGPTNPTELCNKGTASAVTPGYSEYTWTCGSTKCDGVPASCSAPGIHCGWVETSP